MLYHISREVQTCLQHQEVAIIGDSRMRSIYFHLADTVSEEPVKSGKKVCKLVFITLIHYIAYSMFEVMPNNKM